MITESELKIAEAAAIAHRLDVVLLCSRIERLSAILAEHDLPFPQDDPRTSDDERRHLQACRVVVIRAYELLEAIEELRRIAGTSLELLRPMRQETS